MHGLRAHIKEILQIMVQSINITNRYKNIPCFAIKKNPNIFSLHLF